MSHLIIVPVLLPFLTAVLLLLAASAPLAAVRTLSVTAVTTLVGVGVWLAYAAADGAYQVYALGQWPAPFGIVLVLDRLSALMLLLTAVLALASLLYALRGSDKNGSYFHALFHLQLMGLNGAFLTGDIFNLFVFFEVLLIASYGLLLHGGSAERLRSGFHYVTFNLAASALFLIAVALLYGLLGTLNMADLARAVRAAQPQDAAWIRAGALLLLVVFGAKAALLPLYFWLPPAYGAAAAPVAALFAIMTKVGVYAIARVYTLVFGADAGVGAQVAEPWLLPVALLTAVVGSAGALAARGLREMVAYLLVASIGTMLAGIGLFSVSGVAAGLYYMVHSTLVAGGLFLVADLIAGQRGADGDRLVPAAAVPQAALLGVLFLVGGIAVAGLPPSSGFIGKLLVLQAAPLTALGYSVWAVVLATGLLGLLVVARAGSVVFWNVTPTAARTRAQALEYLPAVLLLGATVVLAVAAEPVRAYAEATARQLLRPDAYIAAVLGPRSEVP